MICEKNKKTTAANPCNSTSSNRQTLTRENDVSAWLSLDCCCVVVGRGSGNCWVPVGKSPLHFPYCACSLCFCFCPFVLKGGQLGFHPCYLTNFIFPIRKLVAVTARIHYHNTYCHQHATKEQKNRSNQIAFVSCLLLPPVFKSFGSFEESVRHNESGRITSDVALCLCWFVLVLLER